LSTSEPELALVPIFCDKTSTFVDIGASQGLYSFRASPWSKDVRAFDPRFVNSFELKRISRLLAKNIILHDCALSDENGQAQFSEVANDLGRSHFADLAIPATPSTRNRRVDVRTLDSFNLERISMIKIDVEGAELRVLQGATKTIIRERPVVLVESEKRHNPESPESILDFFATFNYRGFFYNAESWTPIENYNSAEFQKLGNAPILEHNYQRIRLYINNFLFLPREKVDFPYSLLGDLKGN
jgi:FkbM family methyltransferase